MNRLVLIDGNAILHRAYHALPPLTAPDGSVVNAVYGFASILIRLFNDLKPTHMAVVFDRPEPTFRKKMLKAYQAQRPEMEDSLVTQIPKVQDLVRAFGIPIYDSAGFEADDVIGSLVKQASDEHMTEEREKHIKKSSRANHVPQSRVDQTPMQVIIVTGDRDLLQLVDGNRVLVFMPTKGLSEGKLFGESETKERMGVAPDQISDLKALMGDSSDNYPGVAGIGPKTAVDLLTRFKTLDALYKAVDGKGNSEKIAMRIRERLKASRGDAFLSQDLASIRTNAPVEADFATMRVATLDTSASRRKLEEFNFKSLVKRLSGDGMIRKETKREKAEKPKKKLGEQQALF